MQTNTPSQVSADVAVVGAGPAGMMAAIAAAEGGRVLVLEQLDKPGAKLLATGGGRCNLTNTLEAREFMARFGRGRQFIRHAIAALDGEAVRTFFRGLDVETVCPDGMAVYPATQSAATVQRALYDRCLELGVQFRLGAAVKDLWVEGGVLRGLAMDGGRIETPRVIVAAGGRSYPSLGGTGGGYGLARQGGHTIIEPTPALVDLRTRETWPRECAGISLSPARVRIDLPGGGRAGAAGSRVVPRLSRGTALSRFPGRDGRGFRPFPVLRHPRQAGG
jgi:predicted Rossmann fold flavoprotein